jgi:hypothetical protein
MSGQPNDKELQRLRQIQDNNTVAIERMRRQLASQGAQPKPAPRVQQFEETDEFPDPTQMQQQPQNQGPQYNPVDPNGALVQHIIQAASQHAANTLANNGVGEAQVRARMGELMDQYPALRQDDHPLTIRARDEMGVILKKNPALDQATAYELATAKAAAFLRVAPANQSLDEYMQYDYTMGVNPGFSAAPTRGEKNDYLTKEIIYFADLVGVPVDSRTPEGKAALKKLNEYSKRFKAHIDQSEYKSR